ncbi:ankyrin repeat-containing domain protein [Aspergillus floccosus]
MNTTTTTTTNNMLFLHAATTGDLATLDTEYRSDQSLLATKDTAGRTALHLAALHRHAPVLERLLTYGIDSSITDSRGQTALHIAAQMSDPATVEILLQRGANWSIRDHDGKTPLFYAYQHHSLDVLGSFLKYTPSYATESQCGLTPEIILRAGAGRKWTPTPTSLAMNVPAQGRQLKEIRPIGHNYCSPGQQLVPHHLDNRLLAREIHLEQASPVDSQDYADLQSSVTNGTWYELVYTGTY